MDDHAVEREIASAAATRSPKLKRAKRPRKDPMAHGLPKRYTDAGIRERNDKLRSQGRLKRPGEPAVSIVRDEWDNTIQARMDAADGKLEPWSAPDPMKEACERVPAPGMRRRFLSGKVIQRRGMRGWQPVKDKRGDLVKLGEMFLGEMPEEKAQQRNRYYQEQSRVLVREMDESHESSVEKIVREGKKHGLTVLRPGEIVQGASAHEFMNLGNPARRKDAIGTQIRRGNSA